MRPPKAVKKDKAPEVSPKDKAGAPPDTLQPGVLHRQFALRAGGRAAGSTPPPSPPPDGSIALTDIATAAVNEKGSGTPLDPGVRRQVTPYLRLDTASVRVHGDTAAQRASAAMGARAFAFGRDVFLGPSESATDVGLMAHELTHVAQQTGTVPTPAPLRVEVGPAGSPAETEADAVTARVVGGAPPTALLVDTPQIELGNGQMLRSAFLAEIKDKILETAKDTLGTFWSVAGCPYIERWFAKHTNDDARTLEAIARRYSGVTGAQHARDYIPPILGRLRRGIEKWRDGQDVTADLASAGLSISATALAPGQESGAVQRATPTPADVARDLGPGEQLPASTASRMSPLFGVSLNQVRVHTGPQAARMTSRVGAAALTVGTEVAFAPGKYHPGTPAGDALLAHELAHVVQQRDVAADPDAWHRPMDVESRHHELDADAATLDAVNALRGGSPSLGQRISLSLKSGLRLQRCPVSDPAERGLIGTAFQGSWLGKKVGEWETDSSLGSSRTFDVRAQRTLGIDHTEAAALARIKTNNAPGAVTLEGGKYVSYETSGFHYSATSHTTFGHDIPITATTTAPTIVAGVVALVSNERVVIRPGIYDPSLTGLQTAEPTRHLATLDDPFQGYKDALAEGKSLSGLDRDVLVAAFQAAMKDTAFVVLNKSEQVVQARKERFDRANAGSVAEGVGPDELATMKAVAEELAVKDERIDAQEAVVLEAQRRWLNIITPYTPWTVQEARLKELEKERKILDDIKVERRVVVTKYPLLSRVNARRFKSLSSAAMIRELGAELPGILSDIATTRKNLADGAISLWSVDSVVEATIAGLGLDETARKIILDTKAAHAKANAMAQLARAVFSIGFAIAAAFATGGLSLVFSAGALGIGLYDAVTETNQYFVNQPASNIDENKDAGFVEAPGWGWLVVAWVGVGLDSADVVRAVKAISKAEKTVAQGAEALAEAGAKRLKVPKESLVSRLRTIAGDVDGATKFGEVHKAAVAGRFGTLVDIDPKLVGDVRVMYEVEKGTGRVTVKGVKVGPEATLAEVLAHEEVVRLMRRYDGLSGKIRELWDRLVSIVGSAPKTNPFPPGSQAFNSWYELRKLPELVEARLLKFGDGAKDGVKAANESALRADLDFLADELARHQKFVDTMALEKGADFIAKTGDSTKAAMAGGYPLPPDITSLDDIAKSAYYYRVADKADGTFILVRKQDRAVSPLRPEIGADGKPTGKFIPGDLTRAEEAVEIVKRFSPDKQRKFAALKAAEEAKGNRVVPIEGMSTTEKTILKLTKEFGPPDFKQRLFGILLEALQRKGDANAVANATKAVDALLEHPIVVIRGTDQLRAYGYRAAYLRKTGKATEEVDDLHHMIPLYLGGEHTRLIDLSEDLHRRLHELVEGVQWDKAGTSLAPSSIQRADLNFQKGAAILHRDGTVTYNPL